MFVENRKENMVSTAVQSQCHRTYIKDHKRKSSLAASLTVSALFQIPQSWGFAPKVAHEPYEVAWWSQENFAIFASIFFPGRFLCFLLIKQQYVTC